MDRRGFMKAGAALAAAGMTGASAVGAEEPAATSVKAGSGVKPLTGSFLFIQHVNPFDAACCDKCLIWKEENWRALIRDMHGVGMDTGIWINTAFWGRPLFPGYVDTVGPPLSTMGCPDPMGVVADEADRLGMKLFYGIGFRGRCSQVRDYARMDKPWTDVWFTWNTAVAEALVERYGDRPSFAGLYISYEIDFHDVHIELYEKLTKEYLRPAVGDVKLLASPGNIGRPKEVLDTFPKALERTGIDILAPQDCGGRSHDASTGIARARANAEGLAYIGKPLRDMGIEVWANCELFVKNGLPDGRAYWAAGPMERIKEQMAIQSEVADKLICFIYQGAMNRKTDLVDIGHSSTQRLYDEYGAYLRELG